MKKIYLLFLFAFSAALSFAQSTAWIVPDSNMSIVKPGSGPGNPVWNVGSMPLMHNGTAFTAGSTSVGGGNGTMMDHLYYHGFNLSIPGTATITGVEVIVSRFGCNSGSHSEDTISLAYNSAAIGNPYTDTMPSTGSTDTFGSSTDLWGTALTPAMVNHYRFGVFFDTRAVGICTFALQDCRIKVHYQTTTGVNEVAVSKAIRIYPNPATNVVTLISPGGEYSITDQLGREVMRGSIKDNSAVLDISPLSPGLYFICSGNEVVKFMKQ